MLGHFFSTFVRSESYHEDPPACSAPERAGFRDHRQPLAPGSEHKKPGS